MEQNTTAPDLAKYIRTRKAIDRAVCLRLIEEYKAFGLPGHQYSRMLRLARRHNINL